jgi:cytochrome c553
MKQILLVAAVVLVGAELLAAGQSAPPSAVFTAAQAAAGKIELQKNAFGACSDCHTSRLTGRIGDAGELPALSSLSADTQKMIRDTYHGKVPPLAGTKFIARWSTRTTQDLTADFKRRFASSLSEETRLDIVAYLLESSGAVSGTEPLTMETSVEIGTLVPSTTPK